MADVRNKSVNVPTPQFNYKDWTVDVSWTYDDDWTAHHAYQWAVNVNESLNIRESNINKDPSIKVNDSFSIKNTKVVHSIGVNKKVNIRVQDHLLPQLTFIRKYAETIGCHSLNGNTVTKPFSEEFSAYDSLNRSGQGVVSDIIFESGEWTMDEVTNMMMKGKPAGYTNFKPFISGDYTFQDALFRTVLDSDGGTKAVIEQFKIAIDVPDVSDRGSAELVDKNYNLRVDFYKKFHTAPEVNVTMRSGVSSAPITPIIVSIDEKGFVMYLINALTGEKATGKFIWTAVGY